MSIIFQNKYIIILNKILITYKKWRKNMDFKNIILVFSLILCILFSISCVAASDVNDTLAASDVEDANMTSANENQVIEQSNDNDLIAGEDDGTFTELQAKIILASEGATINLEKDYAYNDDFKITSGIFIDKDLTINGNGHSIDGMSKSRILAVR